MSTKEKLIARFISFPSDFTFDELCRLFSTFGYHLDNKGSTSGSRVVFIKDDDRFYFHKPHPGNTMRIIVLKQLFKHLRQRKLL